MYADYRPPLDPASQRSVDQAHYSAWDVSAETRAPEFYASAPVAEDDSDAQAANDRLLGASILDAMSHQATFAGRYTEAATLARAALQGTRGMATPSLTAHFHAMEAHALARLHDAKACGHALSEAMREFERRPAGQPAVVPVLRRSGTVGRARPLHA